MNLADTLQKLYSRFGTLPGVTIECHNELIAIGIRNRFAKAEIFLQGAHITRYQRHEHSPLLFMSEQSKFEEGIALRGGVPICWPWFGSFTDNPACIVEQSESQTAEAPAHGFARVQNWQLDHIEITEKEETLIELSLNADGSNPLWPYRALLSYQILIGESLSLSLTTKNTDTKTFNFSSALHSYFSVSDIQDLSIEGFEGALFENKLVDYGDGTWETAYQEGVIQINEEVDRVYEQGCESNVSLKDGERTILFQSGGSNSTVVWNPWIEKAQKMADFGNQDYQRMVCIETANARKNFVSLAPDTSHSLSLKLR